MYQRSRIINSLDEARLRDGDVTDSLGRVLYRATLHGWLWCGTHRPIADAGREVGR
jgi:hypothetical protein